MYSMDSRLSGLSAANDPSVMDKFRAKVTEFRTIYSQLLGMRARASSHPNLFAEYQALVTRGGRVMSTINGVISKAEGAWDFMKSAPGAAYDWIRDAVGLSGADDEPGLGIIPIVLGAAALGAIALIASWTTDALVFMRKMSAVEKLVAAGMPVEEAARAVQGIAEPPKQTTSGNLSTMAMWLAVGAIAIFVLPKFLDNKGSTK